jgi:hypothetical protein
VSKQNGNGGKPKNHVENHVGELTIPGRNGGRLRNGGTNKGGPGRTPNIIRQGFRDSLPNEEKKLRAHVREIEKLTKELEALRDLEDKPTSRLTQRIYDLERLMRARGQLMEFQARYGLGTTHTETDTEGNDAPRPQVIAYIPENGRISR